MFTNHDTVDINAPGIAIICNAWAELDKEIHKKSFQVTLECIDSHSSIESILLAGTHVNLDKENQGPNNWYDNSRTIFVDEQGVDWIRRLWQLARDTNQVHFRHNPFVRDHNYHGRPCIGIWEQWQLEWLLNHYFPHIENVWYFGAGLGVRRDPFGWAQLCDLIKFKHVRPLNILSHKFGMINNRQNSHDFSQLDFEYIEWDQLPNWQFVNDDVLVKTDLEWQ